MPRTLQEFVFEKTGDNILNYNRIGGGFYADVYRFNFQNKQTQIIKVYKSKGLMIKEVSQLRLLSKHSAVSMPEVLWTHSADENFFQDILAMNYLKGINGGSVFYLNPLKKANLASQVTDHLLSFHNVHNPDGFGEIDSEKRYNTFNEYYKNRAANVLKMAEHLHERVQISDYVLDVVKEAIKKFDEIFYLPITEATLIHGDYNMWNILVDKKACEVTAIIDPCGCMWADSEFDLYQLNNANGKHLRLFETYAKKKKLSANCKQKMAFYELFTETEHYYNSGYPVNQRKIKKRADKLKLYL